jgi:hypothetical protein
MNWPPVRAQPTAVRRYAQIKNGEIEIQKDSESVVGRML